jgi:HTH-type transcriptional regulator, competence development regulator
LRQLTLRQVEEATGVSNAYLSQLETGKIKKPSANVLYKLATIYGVELQELLKASGMIQDGSKAAYHLLPPMPKNLTEEEEQELLKYLEFLRFRKSTSKEDKK